jgi:chloramphenicol-sensitive protein RarD
MDKERPQMTAQSPKIGIIYALAAFGFWGFVPIYFKAVREVPPIEVLAHRIVWSVPLIALLITLSGNWKNLREALPFRRVLGTLFLSSVLVMANWFVFIYAISTDRVLQASLGYFINPLVNVILGVIFLRERLGLWQAMAVLLAAIGTLNLVLRLDEIPWISLFLAFSFGFYGLLRKTVQIEALNGLFVETGILCPFAAAYLLLLAKRHTGSFGTSDWAMTTLLFLAGAVTTLPLLWFTSATRRLRYTTIGLFQYLAPSLNFYLAVFYYNEPFTTAHFLTFSCIWTGLAIFVTDSLMKQKIQNHPRK